MTVDKKRGYFSIGNDRYEAIDLPGIHSLFSKSEDERLVVDYLLNSKEADLPEKLVVVVSALNLKKNLYLLDQLRDLSFPIVLVVNMMDAAQKKGIHIDERALSEELGVPVVLLSAKRKKGLEALSAVLSQTIRAEPRPVHYLEKENEALLRQFIQTERQELADSNNGTQRGMYASFLKLVNQSDRWAEFIVKNEITIRNWRTNESILRYRFIQTLMDKAVATTATKATQFTTKADRWLVHPIWGYVILALVMLGIFQTIFSLAVYPMDWIEAGFAQLSTSVNAVLPTGYFSDLITEGVLPGIEGILIFIPQIALLFFLFSILEESGYMQRMVYLMDRIMQQFGMSGKSVIPMVSGMACAVPAVMATRTIENYKERLITLLVTPLMTCSARIPVYVTIIALVIPDELNIGIFNAQGVALMGMYFIGFLMTLLVALVFKRLLKSNFNSFLVIDLPELMSPNLGNVVLNMWNNVRSFVWNAGKIILATTVILFVLATNGGTADHTAEEEVAARMASGEVGDQQTIAASVQLERSYLGTIGKGIEPFIRPLGYDWKIGIALLSSLAAREVFISTIAVVYSIDSDEEMTVRDRLKNERRADGSAAFSLGTSVSLLLFYAFALQCLSTIAVVYKETRSLKWTGIQFLYMTALAYTTAWIAYLFLQ